MRFIALDWNASFNSIDALHCITLTCALALDCRTSLHKIDAHHSSRLARCPTLDERAVACLTAPELRDGSTAV
eukprot:4570323-Pleurochrysis_carterae.AAC.1